MSIRLRRPAATLPSSSGPLRHPGRHPRRFAFGLAAAAAAAALLLLPHAAAQPLRLGGGVPVPSGGFEEDGSAELHLGSMVMSIPDDANTTAPAIPEDFSSENFDCLTLQELSETTPELLQGSDLAIIKEKCDQGLIFTSDEVAEAVEEYEGPNPNLDNQITIMATDICEKASTMDDQFLKGIKEACAADPRDDEHVVDVATKLQAQHSPTEDTLNLSGMCTSLNENRAEIEAGLTVLKSRSNERRLDDSNKNEVTSFNLASDMLVMLECLCDTNNPDNEGCTKKQIRFAESTAQSVMEKAEEDFASEGPENVLSEFQSSIEKHTNHLRQQSGLDGSESSALSTTSENDLHTSVERAELETGAGICAPPGVQATPTGGYKICLYAGPVFECEISWDPYEAGCVESSCGGGYVVKLVAAVKFCAVPSANLQMELKLCVDVVSDILNVIGRYVPGAEGLMNSFGLYGGCYRLAWAQYDIAQNRFQVTAGPHKHSLFFNFKCVAGAKAFMRFKGHGCNYSDDRTWATYESIASSQNSGKIDHWSAKVSEANSEAQRNVADKKCAYRISQWAIFEITFGLELDWWFTTSDIWSTAAHFLAGGNGAPVRAYSLNHGDLIHLKQPDHGTYLGMCGHKPGCGASQHGVLGFSGRPSRTKWRVEKSGSYVYLKQPDHNTYVGLCGVHTGCGESKHGALGFPSRESRTKWQVEESGGYFYFKQPDHGTYLGMCGHKPGCGTSEHGVLGISGRQSRTKWILEKVG